MVDVVGLQDSQYLKCYTLELVLFNKHVAHLRDYVIFNKSGRVGLEFREEVEDA